MPFYRTAQVQALGAGSSDGQKLTKVAQRFDGEGAPRSYYLDGARKLPIRDMLERYASAYNISADPAHYLYEAIRANTTNCPNENNDGFHQAELLRHDTRLRVPVYETYIGKPHHHNHKTSNPKTAFGLILDAHYNDTTPPLANCPQCNTRTALRGNRDETGLHCKRCGQLVRDEFVEILVGIDARKDPAFANGVRTGQMATGSMGCNCLNTKCNVCSHVAYSKNQFCAHIQQKGSLWLRQGADWRRIDAATMKREAQRRKLTWTPDDFCYLNLDGFEVRKAFEYCQNVVFDEYSRVEQPADPKARQRELFLRAASSPSAARQADLDCEGCEDPEHGHRVEAGPGDSMGPGEAPPAPAAGGAGGVPTDAVVLQAPVDRPVVIQPAGTMPAAPAPAAPAEPAAPSFEIEDLQPDSVPPNQQPQQQLSPGDMGMMPPGASAPPNHEASRRQGMFNQTYKGWTVEVTPYGNAKVLTAAREPIMVLRGKPEADAAKRTTRAASLLADLHATGAVAFAAKHNAIFQRAAQVVDGAIDDMKDFADKYMHDSVLDDADDDMVDERAAPHDTVVDDQDDDMQDARGAPPDSTQEDGVVDHEVSPGQVTSVTQDDNSVMQDKRKPVNLGQDSVLDNEVHTHTEPLSGKTRRSSGRAAGAAAPVARAAGRLDPSAAVAPAAAAERSVAASATDLTRPGTRIAHKNQPEVAWTVRSVTANDAGGLSFTIEAGGQKRKIGESDLRTFWQAALRTDKDVTADVSARIAVYEERNKKAWAAREAKLKADAAKDLETAQMGAIESFCRALRLAARRQTVELEPCAFRQAAEQAIAAPRQLGVDAHGQAIPYNGMDPHLARYLTTELMQGAHPAHLEGLMSRAADLMAKGDAFLLDAESDASNYRASLPPITAAVVGQGYDPAAMYAGQMHHAMLGGNLNVTTAPPPDHFEVPQNTKRAAIRAAVGGTSVANQVDRFRTLN